VSHTLNHYSFLCDFIKWIGSRMIAQLDSDHKMRPGLCLYCMFPYEHMAVGFVKDGTDKLVIHAALWFGNYVHMYNLYTTYTKYNTLKNTEICLFTYVQPSMKTSMKGKRCYAFSHWDSQKISIFLILYFYCWFCNVG